MGYEFKPICENCHNHFVISSAKRRSNEALSYFLADEFAYARCCCQWWPFFPLRWCLYLTSITAYGFFVLALWFLERSTRWNRDQYLQASLAQFNWIELFLCWFKHHLWPFNRHQLEINWTSMQLKVLSGAEQKNMPSQSNIELEFWIMKLDEIVGRNEANVDGKTFSVELIFHW